MRHFSASIAFFGVTMLVAAMAYGQRIQFPNNNGLRPIQSTAVPSTVPQMVPINGATQAGIFPANPFSGTNAFDPYASSQPVLPPQLNMPFNGQTPIVQTPNFGGNVPYSGYPGYSGNQPVIPGAGQSGVIGTFPGTNNNFGQPSVYPNSSPSALFPGNYGGNAFGSSGTGGGLFGGLFGGGAGNFGGSYGAPAYNGSGAPGGSFGSIPNWNPQGTIFSGTPQYPQALRFFQGPRFRHAWIYGNEDADGLMINDSDLSVAFAFPNFLYSTQPLYIMPSFSLHQWDGPHPPSTADLPALAYSAFLDSGWQSDPARILGAELGLRVGMFTDFDTASTDSLRIMGRGIGRVRLTPRATLKLGVIYLDRNRVKLLPAGGLLWQPNPDTRFDLFFPEPKLAHYLATVGTMDTWWYAAGYYGGGAWTVQRADGTDDSIDINDMRIVFGLEWGRNEQMREGRRFGFLEVGYVFERELLYEARPADNLDLQSTVMVRAGIGY